eukprot:m.1402244 g.1402244  ORF g.1402244 m.1402244 type:complete len:69 (+) comp25009_c0_seq53:619-825(+)
MRRRLTCTTAGEAVSGGPSPVPGAWSVTRFLQHRMHTGQHIDGEAPHTPDWKTCHASDHHRVRLQFPR